MVRSARLRRAAGARGPRARRSPRAPRAGDGASTGHDDARCGQRPALAGAPPRRPVGRVGAPAARAPRRRVPTGLGDPRRPPPLAAAPRGRRARSSGPPRRVGRRRADRTPRHGRPPRGVPRGLPSAERHGRRRWGVGHRLDRRRARTTRGRRRPHRPALPGRLPRRGQGDRARRAEGRGTVALAAVPPELRSGCAARPRPPPSVGGAPRRARVGAGRDAARGRLRGQLERGGRPRPRERRGVLAAARRARPRGPL